MTTLIGNVKMDKYKKALWRKAFESVKSETQMEAEVQGLSRIEVKTMCAWEGPKSSK